MFFDPTERSFLTGKIVKWSNDSGEIIDNTTIKITKTSDGNCVEQKMVPEDGKLRKVWQLFLKKEAYGKANP